MRPAGRARLRRRRTPLAIGITGLGVALKKTLSFDLGLPPDEAYRWLLCATLAIIFFSTGLIDSVTERRSAELSDRMRVNDREGSPYPGGME